MPLAPAEFWKLASESRLVAVEECHALAVEFEGSAGGAQMHDAKAVAKWLVGRGVVSPYQAKVLLAGQSGPFDYGDYRLHDRVEGGPFAGWFRAKHRPTGHPVMLQFLTGEVVENPSTWPAIRARVAALSALNHPLWQRYFAAQEVNEFKFLVAENLDGQSLDEHLSKAGRLSVAEACRIGRVTAVALAEGHRRGFGHGQLCFKRILVTGRGLIKLLVAPAEPLSGKAPDAHADIYALGCLLYELLAGRVHTTPAPLEDSGVPPALANIVAKMMAEDAAARMGNAAIVAQQLSPFVEPSQQRIVAVKPAATLPAYEEWLRARLSPATPAPSASPPPVEEIAAAHAVPQITVLPIVSTTSTKMRPGQRQSWWRGSAALVSAAAGGLLLLTVIAIFAAGGFRRPDAAEQNGIASSKSPSTVPANVAPPVRTADIPAADARYEVVPDDGQLLWASPTTGRPIDLEGVPPDARILLVARPADMLAEQSGADAVAALGPDFAAALLPWESAAGVPLADIEQLVVALHDNRGEMPTASLRVKLAKPQPRESLVVAWGNPVAKDASGRRYDAARWSYYVPDETPVATFTMGTRAHIDELVAAKGAPPILQRDIAQLLSLSDAERHVTLLFAPNYLLGDGEKLLGGRYEKLKRPLAWLMGDDVRAAMLSLHVADSFYLEARLVSTLDQRQALPGELRGRLARVPSRVEDYLLSLRVGPYWQKVAARYPLMLGFLQQQTRVGMEGEVAVVNAVAPGALAHNLLFGAEMAISTPPGSEIAAESPPAPSAKVPQSLPELLAWKVSFAVPKNDLNLALADLENEVRLSLPGLKFPFSIKISGKDLEAEGITRNQQIINFQMQDAALAEILTGLMRKANPDPAATSASDPKQKLVWVLAPNPDQPDQPAVLITTRNAAAKDRYTLPEIFVMP